METYTKLDKKRCCCIAIAILALFSFFSCSAFKNYGISKNYVKSNFNRIGLFVVRVGNLEDVTPAHITLETDYSIRKPKFVFDDFLLSTKEKVDVYIDEEKRLKESFPNFPYYEYNADSKVQFFRNITPEIYGTVQEVLHNKGYQVVNIRALSKNWQTPISEMTINEIIDASKGQFDAILIMHYKDTGPVERSYLQINNSEGFSGFAYTLSIFSIETKEKLLFLSENSFRPLLWTIINDPDVRSDPVAKQKLWVEERTYPSGTSIMHYSYVSSSFTEDELIQYVLKYMKKGCDIKHMKWKGLNAIIP